MPLKLQETDEKETAVKVIERSHSCSVAASDRISDERTLIFTAQYFAQIVQHKQQILPLKRFLFMRRCMDNN